MEQFATDHDHDENAVFAIADLLTLVDDLFATMLDMPNEAVEDAANEVFDEQSLQAVIRITGSWNAELRILTTDSISKDIACAMFGLEASELSEEEICDACGEVVNVIGGNVKGIVDQDCNLSIPCVGKWQGDTLADARTLTINSSGETMKIFLKEH